MTNKDKNNFSNISRISDLSKSIKNIENVRKQFEINPLIAIPKLIKNLENDFEKFPRIKGKYIKNTYSQLLEKYSLLPSESAKNSTDLVKNILRDLLGGVPLWRSPNLQYNVGAAVSRVSSALYSTSLDLNIFNINDGLSGNTIIAEHAVIQILSDIAGIKHKKSCGFFTFGGTATNLYTIKLGIAKTFPQSRQNGIPRDIKIAITEDSHFSHMNALNWLGVGVGNAIIIKANDDRTSNLKDAEKKLTLAIEEGNKIPAIVVNGGTTYDNVIDDIEGFVLLRNKLIKKYKLDYIPHVHVDSVIGWAWLMFKNYDFQENVLCIESETLELIKKQYNRIKKVFLADSWGVDFHKGVGSCPIPCCLVMINDAKTATCLSYKENFDSHQLAREFSEFSPVDYTLETSRPVGAALAALGALHSFGETGYQAHLANLVQQNQLLRYILNQENREDISTLNELSSGYVTMIRLYPPNLTSLKDKENSADFTKKVNTYMKSFFKFDTDNRMNCLGGVEYSYSGKYIPSASGEMMSALKFYPTSPYITDKHTKEAIKTLILQKDIFDSNFNNLN